MFVFIFMEIIALDSLFIFFFVFFFVLRLRTSGEIVDVFVCVFFLSAGVKETSYNFVFSLFSFRCISKGNEIILSKGYFAVGVEWLLLKSEMEYSNFKVKIACKNEFIYDLKTSNTFQILQHLAFFT